MPKVTMEFYVNDKTILKGLSIGDQADFTLRYKDVKETIVAIAEAK